MARDALAARTGMGYVVFEVALYLLPDLKPVVLAATALWCANNCSDERRSGVGVPRAEPDHPMGIAWVRPLHVLQLEYSSN